MKLAPHSAGAAPSPLPRLRILFLVSAHNSLSRRVEVALNEIGHRVSVAVVDDGADMEAAVARHRPELTVCPMLKAIIPESIWTRHRCLVVHPGPRVELIGGRDFFSNGIHLNVIEAADDPASESWWNLLAIDDLVREIVETESHIVVSALAGDAAAGGVPLALAADHVVARRDAVLNPYYRHMGGLYGSEYWTYLLPRRVGADATARLTAPPFRAVGTRQAVEMGLLDDAFGDSAEAFRGQARGFAEALAADPGLPALLEHKRRVRARDERIKPLAAYRTEELARSHECFFGADHSYHEARRRFVHKLRA